MDDAGAELAKLLALYTEGQTRPLPLFPATSEAYIAAMCPPKPKITEEARIAAEKQWIGGEHSASEGDDGWNRVVWRRPAEPLSEEWEHLAKQVFEPLLAHLVEEAK